MSLNINKTSFQNTFSKKDTTYFKGIAILMIVIHNYLHILPGFGIENEFLFKEYNIQSFLKNVTSGSFYNFIAAVFSFLGHYGVQIFFFFSAYGLTIQYAKRKVTKKKFILNRLKKVYFLMAFAVVFSVVFYKTIGISFGALGTIGRALILGSTLNSFTTLSMFSGPFWFFAAIIQFYVLFPLLYNIITRFELKKFYLPFLAAFALIYLLYFTVHDKPVHIMNESFSLALFSNVIGHLPELILGIAMAHFGTKSFKPIVLVGAALVFIASQYFEFLFPLSFLAATILLVVLITQLKKITNDYFEITILYIGEISMILFVVNGPFRSYPLFDVDASLKFERMFLYMLLLFILCHVLYLLYSFLAKRLRI